MSMLNKKAGFKPKLGPKLVNRRPGGPSQNAGRISATPAPTATPALTTTSADVANATPPQAQPPAPSPAKDPAPRAPETGGQGVARPPSRGRARETAAPDTMTSTPLTPLVDPAESSTTPAAPSSSAAPAPRAAPKPKPVRGRPARRSQASAAGDEELPTATPDPSAPTSAQPNQSVPEASPPESSAPESDAPATTAPNPAARGRKRKAPAAASTDAEADGETQAEEEGQAEGSSAPPKKRARAKRVVLLPGMEGYQTAAEKRAAAAARRRVRTAAAAPENGEEEAAAEEDAVAPQPKRRAPVRQRELTPEDAEAVEIDQTQVKMAELIKDMRVGKKFSRHDELMERERAKRQKQADKKKQPSQQPDAAAADPAGPSIPASAPDASPDEPAPTSTLSGPRYIIVDGELVVDQSSLRVDRHARARREAGDMLVQEENDFTHQVTSATYLRRTTRPQQWDDAETEKLYWALSMFGTDFETIARMFPGKTRKHVKLKFNREERADPDRIREALVGQKKVGMDMDEYQKQVGGVEYESAEAIYAEQKRAEEEFEATQARLKEEREEEARKRREAMYGAGPNAGKEGEEGGDGGKKKKGKGRGRKKAVENTW